MPAFKRKPVKASIYNAQRMTVDTVLAKGPNGDVIAPAGYWVVGEEGSSNIEVVSDQRFRETYDPLGKEGVWALLADGPQPAEDDRAYIIPFPTSEPQT